MTLLEVKNLKKTYTTRLGGNKVEALSNVSFSVIQGEYVASWANPAPARRRS
jgi:putative ABC transport system ATP-binding protein